MRIQHNERTGKYDLQMNNFEFNIIYRCMLAADMKKEIASFNSGRDLKIERANIDDQMLISSINKDLLDGIAQRPASMTTVRRTGRNVT